MHKLDRVAAKPSGEPVYLQNGMGIVLSCTLHGSCLEAQPQPHGQLLGVQIDNLILCRKHSRLGSRWR